jgi:hypothetical protein
VEPIWEEYGQRIYSTYLNKHIQQIALITSNILTQFLKVLPALRIDMQAIWQDLRTFVAKTVI